MDDYRNNGSGNGSGYEPNFVLKDTRPQPETEQQIRQETEQTGGQQNWQQETFRQHTQQEPYQQHVEGSYKDPRNNFRRNGGASRASSGPSSYSYASEPAEEYDPLHDSWENDTGSDAAGPTYYSGSWNNQNGMGKIKRKRFSGSFSKPVTMTRKTLALLIALCIVVSGVFGIGGAALGNSLFDGSKEPAKTGSATSAGYKLEDATGSNMSVQEITGQAKSSVVEITTESVASDSWMQQYVTQGAGSGVVITDDGYILTNNHVIDGASKIIVTTIDEKEYEATLVGTDSTSDLAVLKINAKNLSPVTYGNSDQLAVGDLAVAIGNPLGELGGTVTAGIISALDRQLSIDGKTMTLLQTDTSINPGNSGGGLFNGDGQLIGIVVAKSSGSDIEGLGFAIPINTAAEVAQQIMDKGYVSGQPSTGMTYTEADNGRGGGDISSFFGGEGSSAGSVYIYSVDGTNAKEAGFQAGDMVYAVDGEEITSFEDLSSIVTAHKVGDKLKYTIIRNGEQMNITLTLEEKTAEQ